MEINIEMSSVEASMEPTIELLTVDSMDISINAFIESDESFFFSFVFFEFQCKQEEINLLSLGE